MSKEQIDAAANLWNEALGGKEWDTSSIAFSLELPDHVVANAMPEIREAAATMRKHEHAA